MIQLILSIFGVIFIIECIVILLIYIWRDEIFKDDYADKG